MCWSSVPTAAPNCLRAPRTTLGKSSICPGCRRRCVPPAQLEGVALGQQRLGINLLSLTAALREERRLPFRVIQWYLDTVNRLRTSVGAIVAATQRVAQMAQKALTDIVEWIRGSPVVHPDERRWREDGHNGCVWTFSIPTQRCFLRRGRGKSTEAVHKLYSQAQAFTHPSEKQRAPPDRLGSDAPVPLPFLPG